MVFRFLQKNADVFTESDKRRYFAEYIDSIGLSEGLSAGDVYQSYLKSRIQNKDGFAGLKIQDPHTLGDLLRTTSVDNQDRLNEELKNLLKLQPEAPQTSGAHSLSYLGDQFEKDIATINAGITAKDPAFKPLAIPSRLAKAKVKLLTALQTQQTAEITQLKNAFEAVPDSTFLQAFKNATGIREANTLMKIKEQMLDELKKSHQEQHNNLENKINEDLNKINATIKSEFERIAWLAKEFRNPEARALILDAYGKKNNYPDAATIQIGANSRSAVLEGINAQDIGIFETNSRNKVIWDPANNRAQIMIPGSLGKLWPGNWHHDPVEDMQFIVEYYLACGCTEITMNVTGDPPDSIILARQAYEACILAGVAPEKIKIKINGELKSEQYEKDEKGVYQLKANSDQLYVGTKDATDKQFFEGCEPMPERLAALKAHAQQIASLKAEREPILDTMGKEKQVQQALKEKLRQGRIQSQAKNNAQPPAPSNNSGAGGGPGIQ